MSKLFTLYVGTQLTRDGRHIDPAEQTFRIDRAKHILADKFGGYSVGLVQGGYVAHDGKLAQEDAIRFEVTTLDNAVDRIKEAAMTLRNLFEQESILLNCTTVESEFV